VSLRVAATNGAHLAVLWAFALVQPLLDMLGRNPAFFAIRGSTGTEIVLFVVALTLLPIAVLLALELLASLAGPPFARGVHLLWIACLITLGVLLLLTSASAATGPVALAAAALAGVGGTAAYRSWSALRLFLSVLGPAPYLFAALFLFFSPVSRLVVVAAPVVHAAPVRAQVPVVSSWCSTR
jgi:hypothetical protein